MGTIIIIFVLKDDFQLTKKHLPNTNYSTELSMLESTSKIRISLHFVFLYDN